MSFKRTLKIIFCSIALIMNMPENLYPQSGKSGGNLFQSDNYENLLLNSGAIPQRFSAIPVLKLNQWNTVFETEGCGLITHIWVTFPFRDKMLGRRNLLKISWDDEPEPSVLVPLSDFFGIPFGYTGHEYQLNSEYLVVAPNNGLNSYFKMPFSKRAKIEIFPEQLESGGGFYIQIDYYRFPDGLPEEFEGLRFHSAFRYENPTEKYGRNYLFLDATGKGLVIGVSFGIEVIYPQSDAWFHGGGDTFFIDGETNPTLLHGIGAEDFFGHSWGVGLREFQSPSFGNPLKEFDVNGELRRLSLYRFFVNDPIPFYSSIRGVIGALGNNYSSVAYWYQTEPHKKFFDIPGSGNMLPESIAPYGTYDIADTSAREWLLLAPFKIDDDNPFETERSFESAETGNEVFHYISRGKPTVTDGNKIKVTWTLRKAVHNFIDFNEIARPAVKNIALPTHVLGYALCYEECSEETDARMFIGFDDDIALRLNNEIIFTGSHSNGFSEENFPVKLKKGKNRILIKLSNFDNTNWRAWIFSFRIERPNPQ